MNSELEALVHTVEENNPSADTRIIIKAYDFAYKKHGSQLRKSGEPYIIHPLKVARILADYKLDVSTVAAGLLHDVLEDTDMTYDKMKEEFGETIANLVNGVTNLKKKEDKTPKEMRENNFHKMYMSAIEDRRVLLIKLADRLHNMRTLKYMSPEKQIEKSEETLDFYANLANRAGIFNIKWELEDLSFKYLNPIAYNMIKDKVNQKYDERKAYVEEVKEKIKGIMAEHDIKCTIEGRPKHFYSIYRKMQINNSNFEDIYDFIAVRIIIEDLREEEENKVCFEVLSYVQQEWVPIKGRLKDYISSPKRNGYKSLHTTVVGKDGSPLEIQIRSRRMHEYNEYGLAAHWMYKDNLVGKKKVDFDEQKEINAMRKVFEDYETSETPQELAENVKLDSFSDLIFVYTPKGKMIELPVGSVPLDFAYKIHSGLGNNYTGAIINNSRIAPIDYNLKNGDIVNIKKLSTAKPSIDWLNVVKTPSARNKIRQWFKRQNRPENLERGKNLLEEEVKKAGYPLANFLKQRYIKETAEALAKGTDEDLYVSLGCGGMNVKKVIEKIREYYEKDNKIAQNTEKIEEETEYTDKFKYGKYNVSQNAIKIDGVSNVLMRMAKCCYPIPGDDIVGYISKGKGLSVHRTDCPNVLKTGGNSLKIHISWDENYNLKSGETFQARIKIKAKNRNKLLFDIRECLSFSNVSLEHPINSDKIPMKVIKNKREDIVQIEFICLVSNKTELMTLIGKLKGIKDVIDVSR